MPFKVLEKKINNINDATLFNFIFAFLLWTGAGLVIYFFYWIKNVKFFGSYYAYLILGVAVSLFIFKLLILKFYNRKLIPVFFMVIIPLVVYCIFFVFVLLWNSASFTGPTIL